MRNYQMIKKGVLFIGIGTFLFTLSEFFWTSRPVFSMIITSVECLLGIGLIYAPYLVEYVLGLEFSKRLICFYWYFIVISVFLGTCLHLMDVVFFWDKILHLTSPMILTALGYGIIGHLLMSESESIGISPLVFVLFGFCFAGVCGVFWEFWEWTWDEIANLNLQRYLTIDGKVLSGHDVLADTIGDLFVNTIGAGVMAVYTWYRSRHSPTYFNRFQIEQKRSL